MCRATGQWTPDGNDQHSRGALPRIAARTAGRDLEGPPPGVRAA